MQHTSVTDLDLTPDGEKEAANLHNVLQQIEFDAVFCSPLKRAQQTAKLAGYSTYDLEDDLFEWRYGAYEGLTTKEIHEKDPKWNLFESGGPEGESVADVEKRAQRLCEKLKDLSGNVLLFSSGHISRVIGAVWVGLPAHHGKYLALSTASFSILGFEHDYPVIVRWNCTLQ